MGALGAAATASYRGTTDWVEPPSRPAPGAEPSIRRRRRGPGAPHVLAFAVAVAMVAKLHAPASSFSTFTLLAAGLVGAVTAFRGARRAGPERRRVRMWIATGLALTWLGDFTFQVLEWFHVTADVTIADVPWLACYGALAIGLHGLVAGPAGPARRIDLDALIDMALAAVAAVLVLWETALRSLVADTSVTVGVRVVWAAYPVLDCVLLVILVRAMTDRRSRGTVEMALLAGASLWLAADFAFLATGGTSLVAWTDSAWMLGAALMAAATLRTDSSAPEPPPDLADHASVGGWRLLLGMTPLLIPGIIDLAASSQGHHPAPGPLLVATAVLVLLASARGLRLVQSLARSRAAVEGSEHYFRSLALNSSDAVLVLDASGLVVRDLHNLGSLDGTLRAPGGSTKQILLADVAVPRDPAACRALFDEALRTPGIAISAPLSFLNIDGGERWVAARMVNLLHDPHVEGVVVNLHDVTAHIQAKADLEHVALHDALTGLANRTLLGERLEHALLRREAPGTRPAVLFLDLDKFKTVNDSLGHDMGDQVLIEVARRLRQVVRQGDTVSRLGGDEFAVLIEANHHGIDEATTTAERIQQAMAIPITVGAHRLAISASVGIAVADHRASASTLLRDADVAMYRAKAAGRARSIAFETEMGTDALERLELETDLANALSLDQFEIVYQPVIELEDERLVGFEALLRWNHPVRGTVMPDRFIPITEETGSIVPIGKWVLETACQQVAEWQRTLVRVEPLTLAVNLSARQLGCRDIVDHVTSALAVSGLDPASLVLEMTETALIEDSDAASVRLNELRALGVKLAIDDFGTGYSSLAYLRQFPIDILKIDRSFTETIQDHADLPAIVRGLLDLGKTLGLDVVAEGIEDELQRDWLKTEQCRFGQGFLFARPLSVADAGLCVADVDPSVRDGRSPMLAAER